jgi:hypothetical protein
MTAEIAIMNREAVAVAADSAVSLMIGMADRPEKIFTTANKIFSLSPGHSLCIMIYNYASFMGIPWETIIGLYRNKLGSVTFDTLFDFASHFIDFLTHDIELVPRDVEEKFFITNVYAYFLSIRALIQQRANELIEIQKAISEENIQEIAQTIILETHSGLASAEFSLSMDESHQKGIAAKYDEKISRAITDIFEHIPLSGEVTQELKEIAAMFFVKSPGPLDPLHANFSGLVITGFGDKDIFPSLVAYSIEGRIGEILKYSETERNQITFEQGAYIVPFAQHEMVDIFLSGIDPKFEQALIESLSASFHALPEAIIDSIESLDENERNLLKTNFTPTGDELVRQLTEHLENYRTFNYTPIVNVVASLPKSDLAAMAESMVNLTSLKRKVSLQAETVSGPVDVAVISKSDGFIWIKKKQYYQPELNPTGSGHGTTG